MQLNKKEVIKILNRLEKLTLKVDHILWSFELTKCFSKEINDFEYLRRQYTYLLRNIRIFKNKYEYSDILTKKKGGDKSDNTISRGLKNRQKC